MLDNSERRYLRRLLKDRFTLAELRRLVDAAGEDFDDIVGQNANKLDAIVEILRHTVRDHWTPRLLGVLIEHLGEHEEAPSIAAELASLRSLAHGMHARMGRGTALEDPFQSCFVRGGWPYVNRPQVRSAFTSLRRPAGFRIAVINGPPGSGKTYSKELAQFVAEIEGDTSFKIYYRDLSEGDYALTAAQLVESILRAWRQDSQPFAQHSQQSSYTAELSEWLAARVPEGETWWIIIDGLAKITPDPGLLQLLLALARHIVDSPHALRLVLLDFGENNPMPPSAERLAARVALAEITIDDVVEHFFRVLHRSHSPQHPFDETQVQHKAQEVLALAAGQAMLRRGDRLRELLLAATEELGYGN